MSPSDTKRGGSAKNKEESADDSDGYFDDGRTLYICDTSQRLDLGEGLSGCLWCSVVLVGRQPDRTALMT
eukprot:scaffold23384_cov158-Skeletonema_marinoi.AAC.1